MGRPRLMLLCSFWVLALLTGAAYGQHLRHVYPWGPETAWTRFNWPELKLRFPFEHLQRTDIEPGHLLHSSNGPHDIDFYARFAANEPERSKGGMLHAYFSGKEALVRCTTCNLLQATVWGRMRVKLHTEGVVVTDEEMISQLANACAEEVPGLMQSVGAMQRQMAEMLAEAGGGAAFPTTVDPSKVSKLCKSLLEVPENGETKSIMDALRRGVRSYASRLNSRVRPKTREGHFDETPVPGVCEDYHSGCGKWALADECDRNPGYMVGDGKGAVGHCRASCGTCLARLPSGELPSAIQFTELDADLLAKVQFQGCNASGICNGVDLGLLPRITSVALTPEAADTIESLVEGKLANSEGVPSPALSPHTTSESLHALIERASKLPGSQCFRRSAGWWTYELCPGVHMKQLHVDAEAGDVTWEIDMGKWDASQQPQEQLEDQVLAAAQLPEAAQSGPVFYLRSSYTGGSQCEMDDHGTSIARESEVRMACSPDEKTYLTVSEPSKCRYVVVLLDPQLCSHPQGIAHSWSEAAKALFKAEL